MNEEIRGTYITSVNFEFVYKAVWAWITSRNFECKNVLITPLIKNK